MLAVGIRDLKQHASELVRQVREQGSTVQVTYHGQVVALLVPYTQKKDAGTENQAWVALDELAAQISIRWPDGVSARQAVAERRE